MWNSVRLRDDFTAFEVRALATRCKDGAQVRRLLSIAAVYDGLDRGDAARIGGMDRQTLRDWVHRFNAEGPNGLIARWAGGPKSRLTTAQKTELSRIVKAGPDPDKVELPPFRPDTRHNLKGLGISLGTDLCRTIINGLK